MKIPDYNKAPGKPHSASIPILRIYFLSPVLSFFFFFFLFIPSRTLRSHLNSLYTFHFIPAARRSLLKVISLTGIPSRYPSPSDPTRARIISYTNTLWNLFSPTRGMSLRGLHIPAYTHIYTGANTFLLSFFFFTRNASAMKLASWEARCAIFASETAFQSRETSVCLSYRELDPLVR